MSKPDFEHAVAIIGAGMSGICMGIQLRKRGITDFVILEKSPDVGGTWHDNTYPGACCDVPSVLYSFSFEPNPDWSRRYSPHNEIKAYFNRCVDKYGLRSHLKLATAVESADYDDDSGHWLLTLADGRTLRSRAVVSGLGQLNLPNTPELPGAESFEGSQFHSARWDHSIDLRDKRIAVIGNAASALQFIPHLARQAKSLNVYQRSANYVIKRNDAPYSPAQRRRFARFPWLQKLHRLAIYLTNEFFLYRVMRRRSIARPLLERMSRKHLEEHITDATVRSAFTPDYPAGCKRVLVSDDYYQSFNRPGVELVTSPITGIDSQGVLSEDGVSRPADVIIYGTGFKTSEMLSAVRFTGAAGVGLEAAWKDGAEAYRGVCVAGFPNFFMLYGPNTNLGSNSIIFMVESQVNYVVRCIDKLLSHQLASLDVNADVMRQYNARMQRELADTVWVARCDSWYKNDAGKVVNNWPHSTLAYWWHMRAPDFTDFDMQV